VSLLASTLALPQSREVRAQASAEGLLLLDPSLDWADLRGRRALSGFRRTLSVERDLVRQWRDGLHGVVRSQASPVTALVRWDKALILSGLAREEGLRVTSTRLSRCVFRVELFV
jgi:hypothetical protein